MMTLHRRTFEAAKHPKESPERARLNLETRTSEYFTSHPWMVAEPAMMSDGTLHPRQRELVRTFKTKWEAEGHIRHQAELTQAPNRQENRA